MLFAQNRVVDAPSENLSICAIIFCLSKVTLYRRVGVASNAAREGLALGWGWEEPMTI